MEEIISLEMVSVERKFPLMVFDFSECLDGCFVGTKTEMCSFVFPSVLSFHCVVNYHHIF